MRQIRNKKDLKMQKQTTTMMTGNINGQVNRHRFKEELDRHKKR